MEVLYYPSARRSPGEAGPSLERGSALTIGVFDGVHIGHRRLIERLLSAASELRALSVVVTFDRHPASVVRPASAPLLLTDLDRRLALLAETGLDVAVVLRFDAERAAQAAEDFVTEVLVGFAHAKAVVVGHDFHFGRGRAGDVALLQKMGARFGFDVTGLRLFAAGSPPGPTAGSPPGPTAEPLPGPTAATVAQASGPAHAEDGEPVSSTRIRHLLAEGEVRAAARLLGRWHQLSGVVGHGDKRGRALGFPTANLQVPREMQLPGDGVYAGWYLRPDGTRHQTAISVGRQPTFYAEREFSLVEAHLLDFQGDLYDELGTVELVERLRGQERFATVEALCDQMAVDVAQTRRALKGLAHALPPATGSLPPATASQ
jgi:riboflavin kinase/FMN adenylyltransferase